MTTQDILDSLRTDNAGCVTVAYCDLSAGLVLAHSAAAREPQEKLDALCAEARRLLQGSALATVYEAGGAPATLAITVDGADTRLFLRDPAEPTEVICARCGADIAVDSFAQSALSSLRQITQTQ